MEKTEVEALYKLKIFLKKNVNKVVKKKSVAGIYDA